jgi:hypothetical protein
LVLGYSRQNQSLLPAAKLSFAALWSIALDKVELAGVTGGRTNLMML